MKLQSIDVFVVLTLTSLTALRPWSTSVSGRSLAAAVVTEDTDNEDRSFNDVVKTPKSTTADSAYDPAEVNNRIPIFPELSDIDRALSSEGSVTGSGEVKLTGEHAQSTTTSGGTNVRMTPKYMLDLYNKFSKDKYSYPMANIVRSFNNINTGMIITARRYASAVYAVVVCLSVRLSVCLSQTGTVPKRLNVGSRKQRHTI